MIKIVILLITSGGINWIKPKVTQDWAGKMAQWVHVLAAEHADLNSFPRTQMAEREQTPASCSCMHTQNKCKNGLNLNLRIIQFVLNYNLWVYNIRTSLGFRIYWLMASESTKSLPDMRFCVFLTLSHRIHNYNMFCGYQFSVSEVV